MPQGQDPRQDHLLRGQRKRRLPGHFHLRQPHVLGAGEGDKTEQKNKPKKKPKKRTLIEKLIDGLGVGDKKPPARTKAKPAKKKGKK